MKAFYLAQPMQEAEVGLGLYIPLYALQAKECNQVCRQALYPLPRSQPWRMARLLAFIGQAIRLVASALRLRHGRPNASAWSLSPWSDRSR